jgi:hypothetical protein
VLDGGEDGGSNGATDAGIDDAGTSFSFLKGAAMRETGPALFTARSCSTESWTQGETKRFTITSSEIIPRRRLLVSAFIMPKAPKATLPIYDHNGQIESP